MTGPEPRAALTRQWVIAAAIVAVILIVLLPPLFAWQTENQRKALSLSNMRRVATGCLIYAEDWDERMPPPSQRQRDGFVLGWPRLVRPYVQLDEAFSNPSNPVTPFPVHALLHDPEDGRPIETSYAINSRFWGFFVSGPFPFDNLEMPEQTVLLAEAGRMAADPRRPSIAGPGERGMARDTYGDTTDRVNGLSPYPSVHGGQFGIIAADGHGVMTRALYYDPSDGPHDKRLGRVEDGVYNWNGGHPNGETDTPAHE
jgi:hypothetical protein